MPSDAVRERLKQCSSCEHRGLQDERSVCQATGELIDSLLHTGCPAMRWDPLPARGVGDLVSRGLAKIGCRKRPGCGCSKRQDMLNRLFPLKPEETAGC